MEPRLGTDITGRAIVIKHKIDFYKNNREYDKFLRTNFQKRRAIEDPWRDVDQKCLFRQINSKITSVLKSHDRNLNERKKKLKSILCEEDNFFQELYQRQMKENKLISHYKQVEEEDIVTKKEEDEFLAKKKLQLDISKCKEIRNLISMRREAEMRRVQELQIQEKEKLQEQEKEAEERWHKLLLEDVEKRKRIEEIEMNQRNRSKIEMKKILELQMTSAKEKKKEEYSMEKEKEQNFIKEGKLSLKESILQDKNEKKYKMSTLGNSLVQQIESKKLLQNKTKLSEIEQEISMITLKMNEYEEELKRKLLAKKNARKEIDQFNEHLSGIKRYRNIQTKNDFNYMNDILQKQYEEDENNEKLFFLKRKELLDNTLNGRNIQMQEKQKVNELAEEQAKVENQIKIFTATKIAEELKMKLQKEKELKQAYKRDLEEQIRMMNIEKEREFNRQKIESEEVILKERMVEKKCKELMEREFNSELIHPFTQIMKIPQIQDNKWYPFIPETKYLKY